MASNTSTDRFAEVTQSLSTLVDERLRMKAELDELTERLSAGKVYLAPQAKRAIESFFQKSNLVALRELSLRQAAHRLRRDVDAAR